MASIYQPMTAVKLRYVVEQTPVIAFVEILDPKSGFFLCLKRKSNGLDTILLLSKAICNVCRVPFDESVKCLCESIVAEKDFWNRCTKFLSDTTVFSLPKKKLSKSKLQNEATINVEIEIWQCVTALCQAITNHEIQLDKRFLKNAIQLIESNKNSQLVLDDHLCDLKKCLEHKQLRDSRNLCPSLDELTSECSSPRNSVMFNGIYKSVAQYVDIHLALLREDYLLPLRRGIDQIISNNIESNDPCVYRNVEILISEKEYISISRREVKKTVCIVADLESTRRKQIKGPSYYSVADYSYRLTNGSLLFFTSSNLFDDLVVAKVNTHNVALLERGFIEIVIIKTYNITSIFDRSYIMYERIPYFYREIYEILKNFTENTFPLRNDLIYLNTNNAIGYPAYVPDQEKVIYKFRKHTVNIKNQTSWSTGAKSFNLKPGQLDALQRSMTQKVCAISASDFDESVLIASEIVATLYANTDRRILIVCHSGKVLTKILADTEMYTKNLARIANHDMNDHLDQFNLNNINSDQPNEGIFKAINAYRYELHRSYREEVDKFMELQSKMKDHQMQGELVDEYLRIQCRMESLAKRLQEMRQIAEFESIKSKRIIGITSYAATKFGSLIQLLRSPIVIVVGAQNILEAHTIAVLTTNLEHLILIGDTKKSEKHSNAFKLSKIYNTDYSLFDRMVNGNIETGKLTKTKKKVEYRGPSILDILNKNRKKIDNPEVLGVKRFVFVLDHKNPNSIAIEFESHFTLALCSYLLKQGFCPEDINILTINSEQMQQILTDRSLRGGLDEECQTLSKVRVEMLTDFKEKNNGIILLSMAASDADDDLVKISREIQTIFARTKIGIYVIGSLPATKFLQKIRKAIVAENAISDELELVCQTHENIAKIHSAIDIDELQFGGCMMMCNQPLRCGHLCKKICHTQVYPHADCDCDGKTEE